MSPALKTLARQLLRLWPLGLLSLELTVQAAPSVGLIEAQLDQLVTQGYEQPEQALRRLRALRDDLADDPATRSTLDYAEAQIEASRGAGAASARALADRLRARANELRRPALAAHADLVGALVADTAGQLETASALAERALAVLEPACATLSPALPVDCDHRSVWRALLLVERFQDTVGARANAEALQLRSLALMERAQDKHRLAWTLGRRAILLNRNKDPDNAKLALERATQLAQGNPLTLSKVKSSEAVMAYFVNQHEQRLRPQLEAVALADEAGALRTAGQERLNLSDVYLKLHRPAEALRAAQQAMTAMQAFQDQRVERTLHLNMALAYTGLGQIPQALASMNKGRAIGEPGRGFERLASELRELGEAMARAGQHKQALALYHEERELSAKAHAAQRDSAMAELRVKYDTQRSQADIDLLQRDRLLKDEALANHALARQAWMAVAVLMALSLVLAVVMVRRVREANRKLAASHALLRAQSERDPLTDLANRRHFMAVMEQQAASHFEGALLMVDIDHFKHVNDRHGHAAGDIVICEVARRLNEAVRSEDLVVRWGGEEFLIYAPAMPVDQLETLAERVVYKICDHPVTIDKGSLDISVSIGYASFPLPPHKVPLRWEQAVNLVDMALYTAKSQGRNRAIGIDMVHVHDAAMLRDIEVDFEQARQNGQLSLQQIVGPVRSTISAGWAA